MSIFFRWVETTNYVVFAGILAVFNIVED